MPHLRSACDMRDSVAFEVVQHRRFMSCDVWLAWLRRKDEKMALFGKKQNYTTIQVKKRDVPDGLWLKCPTSGEICYKEEISANLEVCTKCGHHFNLPREKRIQMLSDEGSFEEWAGSITSVDTLGFTGRQSYVDKLEANQKKSGYSDAVTVGGCTLAGRISV